MQKRLGRQTVVLERPGVILSHAAVGGKQEGEGPLAAYFDHCRRRTWTIFWPETC